MSKYLKYKLLQNYSSHLTHQKSLSLFQYHASHQWVYESFETSYFDINTQLISSRYNKKTSLNIELNAQRYYLYLIFNHRQIHNHT
jgi:hypothetical protein